MTLLKAQQIDSRLEAHQNQSSRELNAPVVDNGLAEVESRLNEINQDIVNAARFTANTYKEESEKLLTVLDDAFDHLSKNLGEAFNFVNNQLESVIILNREQLDLQKKSNLLAANQSQTKAQELYSQGLKTIKMLEVVPKEIFPETISNALKLWEHAVEIDPFNEQAYFKMGYWKCHRGDDTKEWVKMYKEALYKSSIELGNDENEQESIALETSQAIAYSATVDLIENGLYAEFATNFEDFCDQHISDEQNLNYRSLKLLCHSQLESHEESVDLEFRNLCKEFGIAKAANQVISNPEILNSYAFLKSLEGVTAEINTLENVFIQEILDTINKSVTSENSDG